MDKPIENKTNRYLPSAPANWQKQLAVETFKQIEKDFALQGVIIQLDYSKLDYTSFIQNLASKLKSITFVHHNALTRILYQIDLDEKELFATMKTVSPAEIYAYLADRILRRCFEKVYWRNKMDDK